MSLTVSLVPALSDGPALFYDHGTHHRVGRCPSATFFCKLQSQTHILFVVHRVASKRKSPEQNRSGQAEKTQGTLVQKRKPVSYTHLDVYKRQALQKETKTAKTVALTVQEIETMGKKATFGNNITLTPDECDTLKRYAVNGIIANADNKRLKEKLASAEKTVSIWKQRYESVSEKYMELKQKAQPFLDALEIASERVRAFINSILIRGKETQEHKHPAQKRGQDMEL